MFGLYLAAPFLAIAGNTAINLTKALATQEIFADSNQQTLKLLQRQLDKADGRSANQSGFSIWA